MEGILGFEKMVASLWKRPPPFSASLPRRFSAQPPFHRSWSSYPRGYPCPGRVSTLLNQTYSVPDRLVHACLQVTEQVWQPMHLSRFMTIAIWAISLICVLRSRASGSVSSIHHLLRATADHRDFVALVSGRAEIVEGEAELCVATDEVARLDQQTGQRVVDAAPLAGGLRDGHVDEPVLGVVHVDGALRHPVADDGTRHHDTVAVDRLHPVVVVDAHLGRVLLADPDRLAAAGQRQHEEVVLVLRVDGPLAVRRQIANHHAQLTSRAHLAGLADLGLAEQGGHVQGWPEDRQPLTELGDPVVVEVEVHPTRQGVPRLEPLHVDRER